MAKYSKEKWDIFKKDINNVSILKWNVEDPSISVDFLDLTLTIENQNPSPLPIYMPKLSTSILGATKAHMLKTTGE